MQWHFQRITICCQKKIHKNISKNFIHISNIWTETEAEKIFIYYRKKQSDTLNIKSS